MIDRLQGLGHNPIVGRHHQDRHIRHLRTTRPHRRKCLVARRVHKGDLLVIFGYLVGTYSLGYSSSLSRSHVGLSNRVQQRSFPMVHVSHHCDHRRSLAHLALSLPRHFDQSPPRRLRALRFGYRSTFGNLEPQIAGNHRRRLVVQSLIDICHYPIVHQLFNNINRTQVKHIRKIAHRHGGRQDNAPIAGARGLLRRNRGSLGRPTRPAALSLPSGATIRGSTPLSTHVSILLPQPPAPGLDQTRHEEPGPGPAGQDTHWTGR